MPVITADREIASSNNTFQPPPVHLLLQSLGSFSKLVLETVDYAIRRTMGFRRLLGLLLVVATANGEYQRTKGINTDVAFIYFCVKSRTEEGIGLRHARG